MSTFWRTLVGGWSGTSWRSCSPSASSASRSARSRSASGLPAWAVLAFSAFVFAGGSQFLAVGLVAAGNPVAAILGGLLLNARHLPFGLAVADVLGGGWGRRLIGSHLMVDEAVAFALAQPDRPRRRAAYWLTGASIFVLLAGRHGRRRLPRRRRSATRPGTASTRRSRPRCWRCCCPGCASRPAFGSAWWRRPSRSRPRSSCRAGLPVLLGLAGLLVAGRTRRPPAPPTPSPLMEPAMEVPMTTANADPGHRRAGGRDVQPAAGRRGAGRPAAAVAGPGPAAAAGRGRAAGRAGRHRRAHRRRSASPAWPDRPACWPGSWPPGDACRSWRSC